MWNDEDNNPYGTSFERRDSFTSSSANPGSPGSPPFAASRSVGGPADTFPPDAGTSTTGYRTDTSDGEDDEDFAASMREEENNVPKKKGGYDSRIEQILYENPELPILITAAGKSVETGGKYIVYTIRTGDLEVRRRYSEFASLRDALTRLHPTLIVPPIPEKHSMADYAANPTKATQDLQIIDLRKRMLAVFLNRCRRMEEIRNDGVWWRFLDPNASWNEVLHSHPIASIPKSIMRAPPLDPANASQAHSYLPIPATSAKLKNSSSVTSAQGIPTDEISSAPPAHLAPGPQVYTRFPPTAQPLSEQDLDPYFVNFEGISKELEYLLNGSIDKVNRRTLSHLTSLSNDLMELGGRLNGFSLSEPSASLAAAIERVGQAIDTSYIKTEDLSNVLGATFAEPMRESSQFASVVRAVLRYRILKRVQQEMTNDELTKKRALLDSLEKSEAEARRIEQYLNNSMMATPPGRATSAPHGSPPGRKDVDDTASIDSDFPPTHGDVPSTPSAAQGVPEEPQSPTHRKTSSGNFITNRIFGRISHAVHGVVDVDPERSRRDMIGKTRESIEQLEQAQSVSQQDVKDASSCILQDLKRFQGEKEDDLKRYMLSYARSQLEWAKKNKETWEEARSEIIKIEDS